MKKGAPEQSGIYIPSIDAKDIYLSSHYYHNNPDGYQLKLKDGQYNLRKFINCLDYSLDVIELQKIYYKKYRRNDFSFQIKKHKYTVNVMNLTFKYTVKEWNQTNRNTFVKFGYDTRNLVFNDCIAKNESGDIVGIQINESINSAENTLPEYFSSIDAEKKYYTKVKEPKTLVNSADLRKYLYKNGFICNGVKYVRMKRSSGSARVGKCLFIAEPLYKPLLKYNSGLIRLKHGQEVDLAAYESYIALTASSIIDTIRISPENILVIDDYESIFEEDVIETHDEKGCLHTTEKQCQITNNIWDGQSLMDISLFGDYSEYGMVLLRNLMFKSCCFNCNIQQWFKDNDITDISQLNGYTRAKRIEDVKLITTPNSIKYLKFDTLDHWLDCLYPEFGIVKHDKKTHFFDGKMVQTHYQLINTLQMTKEEVRKFLEPSLDFAQKLRDNPAVVRYYTKYLSIDKQSPLASPMQNKNDVVFGLMCINNNFIHTRYYRDFLIDLLRSYYKNLKNGHVLVNGNYSTLLGNPIEMLQQSIGTFHGDSQLGIGNIHSTRFAYHKTLLASRSPHVTMGNIWLPHNTENKLIASYLNVTDEIVCINSIGENVLQRLSGADFDSDSVLLTDDEILIASAKRNYDVFKTPTAFVSAQKVKRVYTPEEQADLDIKTSVNLIGEIINLSQELNSLLWDKIHHGSSYEHIKYLYYDICQLDVMSGIEIDKAKKEFDIDNKKELHKIRDKYKDELSDEYNRKKIPHFFSHISRQKGYYDPLKKHYCKYNTSMDYLQTIVNSFKIRNPYKKDWQPFAVLLDNSKYYSTHVNHRQIEKILELLHRYVSDRKKVFALEIEKEDKFLRSSLLKENLITEIEGERIGFSTLYQLLHSIEEEENSSIKNTLLSILFLCNNESFNKAIICSAGEIEQLEQGGNDIFLFHLGFKTTKKSISSQK